MARHCGEDPRGSNSQGFDEDEEGSHCKQEEACYRSSSHQGLAQAGLQGEEGNLQALQEVKSMATSNLIIQPTALLLFARLIANPIHGVAGLR